jgi:hypothetical protein
MPNRKNIPAFSSVLYRYPNLVERFFNKLRHFRAVATRYDKRDDNFLASVQLASIRIWLRHNESVSKSLPPEKGCDDRRLRFLRGDSTITKPASSARKTGKLGPT